MTLLTIKDLPPESDCYSLHDRSCCSGEFGRVHDALIDYTNQNKSDQTSRDVKRALRAMVRQGFSCGGFPPRGYKAEPVVIGVKRDNSPRKVSRWVSDPDLWEAGKMAWKMRTEGSY